MRGLTMRKAEKGKAAKLATWRVQPLAWCNPPPMQGGHLSSLLLGDFITTEAQLRVFHERLSLTRLLGGKFADL